MNVQLVTGNPALGEGALHLGVARLTSAPARTTGQGGAASVSAGAGAEPPAHHLRRRTLAMVGVPARFVPSDVMQLLGPFKGLRNMRVARHGEPPRWPPTLAVVLLELSSVFEAAAVYGALHGRPFNSFEPEVVRLAFVDRVDWVGAAPRRETDASTCVVCLEPLRSRGPIFTTACDHSFHSACLGKWADAPCPVCRFHPSGVGAATCCVACGLEPSGGGAEDVVDRRTLWVCLICGHAGCGGGDATEPGHARDHYRATLHAYALDVATQHVWDFAGEGYVHRLALQRGGEDREPASPTGGKIAEVAPPPPPDRSGRGRASSLGRVAALHARSCAPPFEPAAPDDDERVHRKLEGLALEYNELLRSQLARQRDIYEARLLAAAHDEPRGDGDGGLAALARERRGADARVAKARRALAKAGDDVAFVAELNATLEADAGRWDAEEAAAAADLARARDAAARLARPLEDKLAAAYRMLDDDPGGAP